MTITAPLACFGTYDALNLKSGATLSSSVTPITISHVVDLKTHGVYDPWVYATFEPDFWLLDGTFRLAPSDVSTAHCGLIPDSLTDSGGAFGTIPYLEILNTADYDTDGFVLQFDDRVPGYCNDLHVVWYDSGGTMITEAYYTPTAAYFYQKISVTGVRKVRFYFQGTSIGYRRIRLLDADPSAVTYFGKEEIRSATLTEQVSLATTELPYNILDFHIYLDTPDFNPVLPGATYYLLQYRQPIFFYEVIGSSLVFLGEFYLATQKSISDYETNVHSVDIIGILDTLQFDGGMLSAATLHTQIDTWLAALSFPVGTVYDSSFTSITGSGWLPIESYRQMLFQVGICMNAIVTCARSSKINFIPLKALAAIGTPDYVLTDADILLNDQNIEAVAQVTGVEIPIHNYADPGSGSETVYSQSLAAGSFKIVFDAPVVASTISVSGATDTSHNCNCVYITVSSPGAVSITARKYIDSNKIQSKYVIWLEQQQNNVIKLSDITLIGSQTYTMAQYLYDYYQNKYIKNLKLVNTGISVAKTLSVPAAASSTLAGTVQQAVIDLSAGFLAKVQAVMAIVLHNLVLGDTTWTSTPTPDGGTAIFLTDGNVATTPAYGYQSLFLAPLAGPGTVVINFVLPTPKDLHYLRFLFSGGRTPYVFDDNPSQLDIELSTDGVIWLPPLSYYVGTDWTAGVVAGAWSNNLALVGRFNYIRLTFHITPDFYLMLWELEIY